MISPTAPQLLALGRAALAAQDFESAALAQRAHRHLRRRPANPTGEAALAACAELLASAEADAAALEERARAIRATYLLLSP